MAQLGSSKVHGDLQVTGDFRVGDNIVPSFLEYTCSTAAGTVAKVAGTTANPMPRKGDVFVVKFTNGNTANSPTLKVGDGAAKPIYVGAGAPNNNNSTGGSFRLLANAVVMFYFTGEVYYTFGTQNAHLLVPATRTVNSKPLSGNVTLSPADIGIYNATTLASGLVKPGANLSVASDGTLNITGEAPSSNVITFTSSNWASSTNLDYGQYQYVCNFTALDIPYDNIGYSVEVLENKGNGAHIKANCTVVKTPNTPTSAITIYSDTNDWGGAIVLTSGGGGGDGGSGGAGTFDLVIRTQQEFEDMLADETWFDAKAVAIPGDLSLVADIWDVTVPANVKLIDGFHTGWIRIEEAGNFNISNCTLQNIKITTGYATCAIRGEDCTFINCDAGFDFVENSIFINCKNTWEDGFDGVSNIYYHCEGFFTAEDSIYYACKTLDSYPDSFYFSSQDSTHTTIITNCITAGNITVTNCKNYIVTGNRIQKELHTSIESLPTQIAKNNIIIDEDNNI